MLYAKGLLAVRISPESASEALIDTAFDCRASLEDFDMLLLVLLLLLNAAVRLPFVLEAAPTLAPDPAALPAPSLLPDGAMTTTLPFSALLPFRWKLWPAPP